MVVAQLLHTRGVRVYGWQDTLMAMKIDFQTSYTRSFKYCGTHKSFSSDFSGFRRSSHAIFYRLHFSEPRNQRVFKM